MPGMIDRSVGRRSCTTPARWIAAKRLLSERSADACVPPVGSEAPVNQVAQALPAGSPTNGGPGRTGWPPESPATGCARSTAPATSPKWLVHPRCQSSRRRRTPPSPCTRVPAGQAGSVCGVTRNGPVSRVFDQSSSLRSHTACHRRGHGALYDALKCGRLGIDRLRTYPAAVRPPSAVGEVSQQCEESGPTALGRRLVQGEQERPLRTIEPRRDVAKRA